MFVDIPFCQQNGETVDIGHADCLNVLQSHWENHKNSNSF